MGGRLWQWSNAGSAADNARIGGFRVPYLAGLVDFFVRKANVGDGNRFCIGSGFGVVRSLDLPPLLRRVIFIGKPTLGGAFDFQRICLCPVNRGDDFIMRTATFTTGVTMGSWSGVSGTISWDETAPYRFKVTGHGKQNVQGGQVVAMNLFDEANAKATNVVREMVRLAGGPADAVPQGSCLVLLLGIGASTVALVHAASGMI
ncbi:MAG: hypothetical protein JY451_01715 [Erythrobacter sp.]|nr:MAG: hypothetical protein JY451_01715 [Erythrobacter sp.]